ncbi:hypothetical protein [Ralstonia pseudosolanacearum]|uniref:hypothetical protein n=1 Tax=Ralstonia pseudosolanacearum TaxID=1310165 RepID=UPI001FFBAA8C|nr:hypothetical protein [Ralstonia pseudosolanacearum]
MEVDVYGKRYPVYKTIDEAQKDLIHTAHNLTNQCRRECVMSGVPQSLWQQRSLQ